MATKKAQLTKKRRKPATRKSSWIVVTNSDYGKLCRAFWNRLPAKAKSTLNLLTFPTWNDVKLQSRGHAKDAAIFFVSRLSDVKERFPEGASRRAKHLLFAEGLPVEAVASRLPRLDIRDAHRLHIAREHDLRRVSAIVFRLVAGVAQDQGPQRIVDAWVELGRLVLLSPSFERLSVPLEKLSKYIGDDLDRIKAFEIDEDGSFLFWPHTDVHIGWEQFIRVIDPTAAIAAEQKKKEFNRRYGAAIRSTRKEHGLTQSEVKGVTDRHLRRVECGEVPASKSLLGALAQAHGLSLADYLKELADQLKS